MVRKNINGELSVTSVRTLAREWALKILYQYESGGGALVEVLDAAIEKLRIEFVRYGSRTSSGSPLEEMCLESLTSQVVQYVPGLYSPRPHLLSCAASSLTQDGPYWQESWMVKSVENRIPGLNLQPLHLIHPISIEELIPTEEEAEEEDREFVRSCMGSLRHQLSQYLNPALRDISDEYAFTFERGYSLHCNTDQLSSWILTEREEFNRVQMARWKKIRGIVQANMESWLRTASFAARLALGAAEHSVQLDEQIASLVSGWEFDRLVRVDKNILRLAGCEMLILQETPIPVVLNEAVELANKYSAAESGRFVNGVLSALAVAKPVDLKTTFEEEDQVDLPDLDIQDVMDEEEEKRD